MTPREDAASRYEVLRVLGTGASGLVQEVRDMQRGGRVALKRLHRDGAMDVVRLREEFRSLSDVLHPHVVRLHELIVEGDQTLLTMDLVQGVTFLEHVWGLSLPDRELTSGISWPTMDPDVLPTEARPEGPPPTAPDRPPLDDAMLDRLRLATRGLCDGLGAIHDAGLLHRDVKPSNVLVEADGHVVLVDFGLAMRTGTSPTAIAGTVPYMSPEQLAGDHLDPRSDWYAVGVMLFEALTGRTPFVGSAATIAFAKQLEPAPSVLELAPDAPEDLARLCDRLLATACEDRPGTSEVRALLGLSATARTAPSPFVGRAAELSALSDSARGEGFKLITVHGPSGMGKTRIVEQWLAGLPADTLVLSARCYEREQAPFKAIDPLVNALVEALLHDPLGATLPPDLGSAARLFPSMTRLCGPLEVSDDDPIRLRRRAIAALGELLFLVATHRRLVLWIDDLQWADVASVRILAAWADGAPEPTCTVVLGHRDDDPRMPEILDPIEGRIHTQIPLVPLPDNDAMRLAAEHLGHDPHRIRHVLQEAQGSPFFLTEMSRWLASSDAHPDSLLGGVIDARLSALEPTARALLEVVAVAARPLRPSLALAATRAAQPNADPGDITTLTVQRLLTTRRGEALECTHDRIREGLASALTTRRLQQVHRSLAEAIGPQGNPEVLSEHWEAAGEAHTAAGLAVRAAQNAERALDFERAAALYTRALRLGVDDPHGVRVALGHARSRAGQGDAADILLEAALESVGPERVALERAAANQMLRIGHFERAYELLPSVLQHLGMRWPASRVGAFVELMWNTARLELPFFPTRQPSEEALDLTMELAMSLAYADMLRSAVFSTRCILMATRSNRPATRAVASAMRGSNASLLGDYATSERWLDDARRIVPPDADRGTQAIIDLHTAIHESVMGRFEAAARRLSSVMQRLEAEGGHPYELDMARTFLLFAVLHSGRIAEFRAMRERAIDSCRQRGNRHFEVFFRTGFSLQPALLDDDPDALAANLDEAEERWGQGTSTVWLYTQSTRAQLDVYCGRHAQALERIEAAAQLAKRNGLLNIMFNENLIQVVRASAAAPLARDDAGARRVLTQALRALQAIRSPFATASAHAWHASACAVDGDTSGALAANDRALEALVAVPVPWHEAMVRIQRAHLCGDDPQTALEELRTMGVEDPDRMAALYAWAPPPTPSSP